MGRRIRESDSIGDVEGLLVRALKILDASGFQLTAIHVDMARCTLLNELEVLKTAITEIPIEVVVGKKRKPRRGDQLDSSSG